MKKILPTFVGVMLTTLSALAMPTKPEVTTMSSWQIGDEVYLYNVEAVVTGGVHALVVLIMV